MSYHQVKLPTKRLAQQACNAWQMVGWGIEYAVCTRVMEFLLLQAWYGMLWCVSHRFRRRRLKLGSPVKNVCLAGRLEVQQGMENNVKAQVQSSWWKRWEPSPLLQSACLRSREVTHALVAETSKCSRHYRMVAIVQFVWENQTQGEVCPRS